MSKSNGVATSEWARAPKPSGPVWVTLLKAIYNPEEKSFLGRTPKRWGIVLVFYVVFYAVLAALFAICMAGLMSSIDSYKPSYILEKSLIGSNPGVAYRPRTLHDDGVLRYDMKDSQQYDAIIQQLNEFFTTYANEPWYAAKTECISQDNYGYPDKPCFFVKVNKIYGWTPQFYSDPTSLPSDMKDDLKDFIGKLNADERQQIWVSCEGLKGENVTVEYPWGRGLPGRYYPYSNTKGYQSPVLAVRLEPSGEKTVSVRCRAWAKNIVYNGSIKEPSGYTLLQLNVTHVESHSTTS